MYCAGPPHPAHRRNGGNGDGSSSGGSGDSGDSGGGNRGGGAVRVSRAARQVFEGTSDAARDPTLREYLSDLVVPFGIALDSDALARGCGHSYGEMAAPLIAQTLSADQPAELVDLVVLAFSMHDVIPGRSTAAYLSDLCPGHPLAFAICDQGSAAPFTALRLISAYARTGSCRRALLVVVEQSAVPYPLAAPAAIPARHAAVTVLLDAAGPGHLVTEHQYGKVAPGQVAARLGTELAEFADGRDDVTLVAGRGLTALPIGTTAVDQVLIAPDGQPSTGVWWELAGGLPGWTSTGRRVLLADYEPMLRYLCLSVIDIEASPAGKG